MSSSDDDYYSSAASKLAKLNAKSSDEDTSNVEDDRSIEIPKENKINTTNSTKCRTKSDAVKTPFKKSPRNLNNIIRNRSDSSLTDSDDENFVSLHFGKKRRKSKRIQQLQKINKTKPTTTVTTSNKKKKPNVKRKRPSRNSTINSANTSVILLSDNENEHATNHNQSISEINVEYKMKVWWQFRDLNVFQIRKYEKLEKIFEHYSSKENIPSDRLLFLVRDKIIKPDDTPASLEINSSHIIEGGVLNEEVSKNLHMLHSRATTVCCNQSVQLKILLKDAKRPLNVAIKKSDSFGVLMAKCSEQLKVEPKKLKFYFDGDILKIDQTPELLGFEGGECIDVFIN